MTKKAIPHTYWIVAIVLTMFLVAAQQHACAQNFSQKEINQHFQKIAASKANKSVVLSLDTIYDTGQAYGIMKPVKSQKTLMKDYSIRSLTGEELLFIQSDLFPDPTSASGKGSYYAFLFFQTGERAEVESSLGLKLERILVETGVIKDNAINEVGKKKLLMMYPSNYSQRVAVVTQPVIVGNGAVAGYPLVERNRNATLYQFGTQFKQDFKVIGTYAESNQPSNGRILKVYQFLLPNGVKVAEATNEGVNSHVWHVVGMRDLQQFTVQSSIGQDAKDIALALIQRYYW